MRRMPVVRGTAAVMAFFTLTTVSASTLMFTYSGAINKALNINTSKIVETDDASAVNTAYYDNEFGTDIPLHPLGRIGAGQYWISVTSRYREDIFCWLTAIQWHSK